MALKFCSGITRLVIKRILRCDRRFTSSFKNAYIENLKQRALLKLSGPDTTKFLQGMVTNDMRIFEPNKENNMIGTCVYALLLNSHGRVLYDCLVYKMDDNDYYLEYDCAATEYMKTHLTMYRLRKDVTMTPVTNLAVWAAYSVGNDYSQLQRLIDDVKEKTILAVTDPRIEELGVRLIVEKETNLKELLTESKETPVSYDMFRYRLGVGEGVVDHPPGSCLPFEINVDFLNGVNFQKGCYMGQELTARVHFTGVIRKRIMPVIITLSGDEPVPKLPLECIIMNENGQKLGKLRSHIGKFGLATLNVDECVKSQNLKLKDLNVNVTAIKPNWWPSDSNKPKH